WWLPRSGLNPFSCPGEENNTDGYLYRTSSQVVSNPSFDLLVAGQLALSEIHLAGAQQCLHRLVRSHAHVADPCIKSWARGLQGVPAMAADSVPSRVKRHQLFLRAVPRHYLVQPGP